MIPHSNILLRVTVIWAQQNPPPSFAVPGKAIKTSAGTPYVAMPKLHSYTRERTGILTLRA
jgi:hypothetical protein